MKCRQLSETALKSVESRALNPAGLPGERRCERCIDLGTDCVFEKSRRGGRQPGAKNRAKTTTKQNSLPLASPDLTDQLPLRMDPHLSFCTPDVFSSYRDHAAAIAVGQPNLNGIGPAAMMSSELFTAPGSLTTPSNAMPVDDLFNSYPFMPTPQAMPEPTLKSNAPGQQSNGDLLEASVTLATLREPDSPCPENVAAARSTLLHLLHLDDNPAADSVDHLAAKCRESPKPNSYQLDPHSVIQAAARKRPQESLSISADSPGSGSSVLTQVGVSDTAYFEPGPISSFEARKRVIAQKRQPEMLNFVTLADIQQHFE